MRVIETAARRVARLRFSPDGGVLTVLSSQPVDVGAKNPVPGFTAALRIDIATGAELRNTLFGPSQLADVSPRGTYVAHVPFQPVKGRVVVALMNLVSGGVVVAGNPPEPVRFPMARPPLDLAYLPDGQTLAVAAGGVVRINLTNQSRNDEILYPAEWLCPSPDGHHVAAGHNYLRVHVWELWRPPPHARSRRTADVPAETRWRDAGDLPVSAARMAASADGRFAAVRADGVHVGGFDAMAVERVLPAGDVPWEALAFSPDGRVLASADGEGRVAFWDPATGEQVRAFEWGLGPLWSVAFAPDGLTCAAGGDDGRLIVWDVDG